MNKIYIDLDSNFQDKQNKKDRLNAQKHIRAKEIIRRLEWLEYPLIYWSGKMPDVAYNKKIAYRPITQIIAEHLSLHPAGIYTIKIKYPDFPINTKEEFEKVCKLVNPEISEVIPVTEKLINDSAFALKASNKYPKALKKFVADDRIWRSKNEKSLQSVGQLIKAVNKTKSVKPEKLAIEELCIWIGPDDLRPSKLLKTEKIQAWINHIKNKPIAGKELAAIVLGQRHTNYVFSSSIEIWKKSGWLLSQWPADIIARMENPELLIKALNSVNDNRKNLNSVEASLFVLEYFLAGSTFNVLELFFAVPNLFAACNRAMDEQNKRCNIFLELVKKSLSAKPLFSLEKGKLQKRSDYSNFDNELKSNFIEIFNNYKFPLDISEHLVINLENACSYLTGIDGLWDEHHSWLRRKDENQAELNEYLVNLRSFLKNNIVLSTDSWEETILGLSGRISAFTRNSDAIQRIILWLEVCNKILPVTRDGTGCLVAALSSIEFWIGNTGWRHDNINKLFEIIDAYSNELLMFELKQKKNSSELCYIPLMAPELTWVIGRFGSLNKEQTNYLFKGQLLEAAGQVLKRNPQNLSAYINLALDLSKNWSFERVSHRQNIQEILFSFSDIRQVKILIPWLNKIVESEDFNYFATLEVLGRFSSSSQNELKGLSEFISQNSQLFIEILEKTIIEIATYDYYYYDIINNSIWLICLAEEWERQYNNQVKDLVTSIFKYRVQIIKNSMVEEDNYIYNNFTLHFYNIENLCTLAFGDLSRLKYLIMIIDKNNRNHTLYELFATEKLLRPVLGLFKKYRLIFESVITCLDFKDLTMRTLNFLHRTSIAIQLQSREILISGFNAFQAQISNSLIELPDKIPVNLLSTLNQIIHFRNLNRDSNELPTVIRDLLNRRESLNREREKLLELHSLSKLTKSSSIRLEKLNNYLDTPGYIDEWIISELSSILPEQLKISQLNALEYIVTDAIKHHWHLIFPELGNKADDPNLDNALLLYYTTREHKAILKKLMKNELLGNDNWRLDHPINKTFLKKIINSGINAESWLSPFEIKMKIHGQIFTTWAETNPLKVLQMGNLFGTCLSVGKFNSYATIANAIEANKRVLYMQNEKGHIIGRKLIGIIPVDNIYRLIGFNSYGSGDSNNFNSMRKFFPWIKIIFDIFCLQIAEKSNLNIMTTHTLNRENDNPLKLFLDSYLDYEEPFDWWVIDPETKTSILENKNPEKLIDLVLKHLDILNSKKNEKKRDETLRAILWLNDHAQVILNEILENSLGIKEDELRFIMNHTQSSLVAAKAGVMLRNHSDHN